MFFKSLYLWGFKFSVFIANITMDFYYLYLFRFYWNYFNIILSFFLSLLEEDRFIYSKKLLYFNIKSINPIQQYLHYWVVSLYSINIFHDIFISNEISNIVWNIFKSKTIKVCYIFSIHIQSYPMSSYWFILIKNYYICPTFYFW